MKQVVRTSFGILFAVGVTAALTSGCKSKATAEQQAAPQGGRGGGGKRPGGAGLVFPVDVITLEAKRVDYLINAPGTIDAFERVQVTARVAGPVDKVAFTEGQQVKKGETLVVIDSQRYALTVNSARAALAKAQAAESDVQAQIARREGASDKHPGLIPGEELATFRTKGLTAKADVDVAREALKTAQLSLRDSNVRAPIDGVIQTRTVETGQYVQTGYIMATLLRNDPMLLRFGVLPQDAPRIHPGMTATFRLRESTRDYTAKITLVGGAADETTRMVHVTAEVNDEGHKYWLRPGSFCDVSITAGSQRDAVTVPRIAVRPSDHGFVVFVVEGDVARERVLQLGTNTKDGWVEVRDGLKAGEQLVVRGGEPLSEGAKVRANQVSAADIAIGKGPVIATPLASSSAAPSGSGRGKGGRGPRGAGSGAPPGDAPPPPPAPPGSAP